METKESALRLIDESKIVMIDGSLIKVEQYGKKGIRSQTTRALAQPIGQPEQLTWDLQFQDTLNQKTPIGSPQTPYNFKAELDQHHIKPTSKYNTRHVYTGALHKMHEIQNLVFRIKLRSIQNH